MKLPFDKCYCLHVAGETDRYNHIINEFKKINILDQVEFYFTCKSKINTTIGNSLPYFKTNYYQQFYNTHKDIYGNVFSTAYNHYNIIKTSYLRGFNNILIMEDDITFINDIDLIEKTFNNINQDYCCIKFIYAFNDKKNEALKNDNDDNLFIKNLYGKEYCTCLYSLNKKGMELYIESFDKNPRCADLVFNDFINDIYVTKKDIAYTNTLKSSIIS